MDRFVLCYNGNKYQESKKYLNDIDLSSYDFIAEPFCGIFGFSRFASIKNFDGIFLLNDIDEELINFYKSLKNNFDETINKYEKEYKKGEKEKSYILRLMGKGIFNMVLDKNIVIKITNFRAKKEEYIKFLNRCLFFNLDYNDFMYTIKYEYEKNKKYLIYYDPPYIYSHNTSYRYTNGTDLHTEHWDESKIYTDILEYFKINGFDSILVTNKLCLLDYVFNEYTYAEYGGKYGSNKVKKHIIYSNLKKNNLNMTETV